MYEDKRELTIIRAFRLSLRLKFQSVLRIHLRNDVHGHFGVFVKQRIVFTYSVPENFYIRREFYGQTA